MIADMKRPSLFAHRSIRNQFVAQIHNCETARDMRETAVSRWGVSRETARDSARQRETARDSARQPRDSRESYVNLCNKLVAYRSTHHRRVGVRRSSVAGARAARAARAGGARAGGSSGARVCFTRRCARGSACARRVTRAAARSFAARRRPAATRPPTLQVTILSCGMVCACAQARARLLQRRPRSSPPL